MPSHRNHILAVSGGFSAHIQVALLKAVVALSRPFGFRGVQRFACLLNHCFSRENSVVIALARGGALRIHLGDGYWAHLLAPTFVYEPEIAFVLGMGLKQGDVFFFDCGANIGHWSAIASALIHKPGQVLAIEASPPCFEHLEQNSQLNNNSFACVKRALWSHDSEELVIITHDERHAGSSVVNRRERRGQKGYGEYVIPSVSLDTLFRSYVTDETAKIILKLDVEGAEIPALIGAGQLLRDRETLVMYEDHFQDSDSKVSDYVLNTLGYDVYYCTAAFNIVKMSAISDVRHAKTHARMGHNFFACPPLSGFSRMFGDVMTSNQR
jgi:FkbM family methyltransferase